MVSIPSCNSQHFIFCVRDEGYKFLLSVGHFGEKWRRENIQEFLVQGLGSLYLGKKKKKKIDGMMNKLLSTFRDDF